MAAMSSPDNQKIAGGTVSKRCRAILRDSTPAMVRTWGDGHASAGVTERGFDGVFDRVAQNLADKR